MAVSDTQNQVTYIWMDHGWGMDVDQSGTPTGDDLSLLERCQLVLVMDVSQVGRKMGGHLVVEEHKNIHLLDRDWTIMSLPRSLGYLQERFIHLESGQSHFPAIWMNQRQQKTTSQSF